MKLLKLMLIIVFACSLVLPTAAIAKEDNKIGFVDLSRLFDEYHKTKEYDKVLEGQQKDFQDKQQAKIDKIREEQDKLSILADDKKAKAEEEIEKLKAELMDFNREQQTELTKVRNEKIREILLEIEKVVSTYAEKENFTVILNDRVLIYGNQAINVTEPILNMLNE